MNNIAPCYFINKSTKLLLINTCQLFFFSTHGTTSSPFKSHLPSRQSVSGALFCRLYGVPSVISLTTSKLRPPTPGFPRDVAPSDQAGHPVAAHNRTWTCMKTCACAVTPRPISSISLRACETTLAARYMISCRTVRKPKSSHSRMGEDVKFNIISQIQGLMAESRGSEHGFRN